MRRFFYILGLFLSWTCIPAILSAQSAVGIGAQLTQESEIQDGGKYVLQLQAGGTPYIADASTYYSVPNSGSTPTTACVYYFYSNGDDTWKIRNQHTGRYWGVPVYGEDLRPSIEVEAGAWSLNFSGGIAYPSAFDAEGVVRGLDRSSQHLWGWTTGTAGPKQVKIYEVVAGLSSEPLEELMDKQVTISGEPVADLQTGTWYTMFDRGYTNGHPHGFLYENSTTHQLYNTATPPDGMTTTTAKYLVRLVEAGDDCYYIQNGFGNYFGTFRHKETVSVVAEEPEPIVVAKIADTDGHFYLQSTSTSVILDANDLSGGEERATVVGWNTNVPTAIGGNNDWAFYPIEVADIPEEIALFESDVNVSRGYQTTGRGNHDALMLRIDLVPTKTLQQATFNFAFNATACANIESLSLYETNQLEFIANIPETPLATSSEIVGSVSLTTPALAAGTHHLWLCADVSEDAELGAILEAALTSIDYTTTAEVSLDVSAKGNPNRQGMKVFDRQDFVFRPTTDNCRFYRIPAMILDQEGNLVVASDKRYNSNSDLGYHKIDVVSKRSLDGGNTWQDYTYIAIGDGSTAACFGYGDCALARATDGTLVAIMAAGNKMWGSNPTDGMMYAGMARSNDNGKTWKLMDNLFASSVFTDENSEDGNLSMTNIFTTSGKGLTTTDGVIMFTTNCRTPGSSGPNLIYVIYSTDNGAHWRLSNALAYEGGDESKLEQLNDGSLLLSVRQSGNRGWNTATYDINADGTVTFNWGSQWRSEYLWGNACNADLIAYSRATDGEPDILLHCYINSSGRQSLQLTMSMDQGKTWKGVYNIQPNGSCYSTMIKLPNGDVAILYEDESYSAGNGYAINYVTLTREQILKWFTEHGGKLPDGINSPIPTHPASGNPSIYSLSGQRMDQVRKGVNILKGRKVVVR